MKIVKKILIGLFVFISLIVAAALILPRVFKNDIKAAVDKAIARNVNADVVFDVNDFSLTFFSHFPNITVEIKRLGVFNRAPFEGIHLFVVDRIDVEVNPLDMLFGDKMRVKGISLIRPQINVNVLKDGRANYNITFPSTDTVKANSQEPGKFSFGIDHWEIVNGDVTYDDKSLGYYLLVKGLNHSGNGDFTQDVFDLRTHTVADTVTTSYGNLQMLTNKRVSMDATITISENISKFAFKDDLVKVNDFGLSCEGWFKMNPSDYTMDLALKSPENTFKSLLSLVPGIYSKDFAKIETSGDLSFSGLIKGTYSDKKMPAFQIDLKVANAMFKYPDLPTPVNNINMDLVVDNKDGVISNTLIDLKRLHVDLGKNPIDARMVIQNLRDYKMDGNLNATLNFSDLSKMFPMQGMEMSGVCNVKASATGIYDSIRKILPAVSGVMTMNDFHFKSKDVPYGMTISKADVILDPQKVDLRLMLGTIGRSDFDVKGTVTNYLGYALRQEAIQGKMTYHSNLLDLNEFMSTAPTPAAPADTSSLHVVPIPKNIDFTFGTSINTVKIMDYIMTAATGEIVVKEGVANLRSVKFNMLGGEFGVDGVYNTRDLQHPLYDFGLKIANLDIQEAAKSFSIVKKYAPVAGSVNGKFGLDFKINGELKQNMTPNLGTVSGAGLIKIADAALTHSTVLSAITALTKLDNTDQVALKNVVISASIANGKLTVKPFDVKFGNYKTVIAGSTNLDGGIDYTMKMNIPAGKTGAQLQGFVNQYTGSKNSTSEIPVTIGIGGTYDKPKATLISGEQQKQVKEAVTHAAEQEGKEVLQKAVKGTAAEQAVKNLLGVKKDTTKTKDSTQAKPADQVNQLLQNKLQNLLKKKKN